MRVEEIDRTVATIRRIALTDAVAPTIEISAEDDAVNVAPNETPALMAESAVLMLENAAETVAPPDRDAMDSATEENAACNALAALNWALSPVNTANVAPA